MENVNLLRDVVLVLAISVPIIFLFNRIKIPSIIGFLITGIIIGPSGFKLIKDLDGIHYLSEIGVALLLFTIGVEISFSKFKKLLSEVLLTGGLQVVGSFLFGMSISLILGLNIFQSVFLGFLITHSSSALILKILTDGKELNSPHGRLTIGILVFQDIMIVPMMLFIPILSAGSEINLLVVIKNLAISVSLLALVVLLSKFIIPKLVNNIVNMQMRDIFIVGIFVILLGTAFLTNYIGLSFAIGAFIAGLIISESDYSEQIISDILPLKEVFLSIFFISLGMLLDIKFVIENPGIVLGYSLLIYLFKAFIIGILLHTIGYSGRLSFTVGLSLAQIGEFSFLLATEGLSYNLISNEIFKGFIASSIITILVSPFIYQMIQKVAFKIPDLLRQRRDELNRESYNDVKNHVIIVGYGLNGKNLIQVLKETGIKYVVVELNPKIFKSAKADGINIIFGDISNKEILEKANVKDAKSIVYAISDPKAAKTSIKLAKMLNKSIYVIVRTLYVSEIDELSKIGADEIIPEEFETSIQIFNRVLKQYHIPQSVILTQSNLIRNQSYNLFRNREVAYHSFEQINQILAQGTIEIIYIKNNSFALGKSLKDLQLREKTGVSVISVVRNNESMTNPPSNFIIEKDDQLIIFGNHISIDRAMEFLN